MKDKEKINSKEKRRKIMKNFDIPLIQITPERL